jgi:tetratricopeptide (TPR) repeat protein
MKRLIFLALILAELFGAYGHARDSREDSRLAVQQLKDQWAEVFYRMPPKEQGPKLAGFLTQARELVRRYPQAAEPLLMEALVLCSQAGSDGGLGALGKVRQAREALNRAIAIDPLAMEGSAYVMLGNLYYRLPGWPLSFGDNKLARQYLETALRHFPDNLDTNFFLGDFLLEQGEFDKALMYLEKAEKAPVSEDARLSDLKLKQELGQALKDAREKNTARASFFSRFLASLKHR